MVNMHRDRKRNRNRDGDRDRNRDGDRNKNRIGQVWIGQDRELCSVSVRSIAMG